MLPRRGLRSLLQLHRHVSAGLATFLFAAAPAPAGVERRGVMAGIGASLAHVAAAAAPLEVRVPAGTFRLLQAQRSSR